MTDIWTQGIREKPMKEQFQGCLLGVAVGDALGLPVKRMTAEEIAQQCRSVREFLGVPNLRLEPGEVADEAQLMGLTLESVCTQRKLDIADMVRRLKGWFRSRPKDFTPLTKHVLSRLDAGERWEEASEGASLDAAFDPPDAGHLSRCLPVALYHALRPQRLTLDTTAVARLTHWDARAVDAALTLNFLVSRLVHGDADAARALSDFLADKNADVRLAVENALVAAREALDLSGSALGALGVGIWALRTASNFEDGLIETVNLGGATDVNAAVAGGLLGARFGRPAIPARWYYALEGHARIEVLAMRLFEHAQSA
jgi:ADP-ribosylglycohydrolase